MALWDKIGARGNVDARLATLQKPKRRTRKDPPRP